MAIRVVCECGQVSKAPDSAAGKKGRCPTCGRTFLIGGGQASRAAPAAAPAPASPPPPAEPVRSGGGRGWAILIVGAVVAIAAAGVALVLWGPWSVEPIVAPPPGPGEQVSTTEPPVAPTPPVVKPAPPVAPKPPVVKPAPPGAPKRAIGSAPSGPPSVRVVSTRLTRGTESLNYPWSGSYRVWTLRAVLQNTGGHPLVFGHTCGLFESNSDGSSYNGMVQTRAEPGDEPFGFTGVFDLAGRFLVQNAQFNDEDNEGLNSLQGTLRTWRIGGSGRKVPCFGTLRPGERFVLYLQFKLGSVMKETFLRSATFISPPLSAVGGKTGDGGFLSIDFVPAGGKRDGPWKHKGHSLRLLDLKSLSELFLDRKAPAATRVVAANLLAEVHGAAAAKALASRLPRGDEASGEVRAAAVQAVGHLKVAGCVDALCRILSLDEEPEGIRRLAAEALGQIGQAEAMKALVAAAGAKDDKLPRAAALAIGRIGGPVAVAALSRLLKDKSFPKPEAAAEALGDCGEAGVAALAPAAADARMNVAKEAVESLGKMLCPKTPAAGEKPAREVLAKRLREGTPALSGEAGEAAFSALARAVRDRREDVAKMAVHALANAPGATASQLLLAAADAGTGPQEKLIEAIAERREPGAGQCVVRHLKPAGDDDVRKAAIHAAVKLQLPQAAGPLITMAAKATGDVRKRAVGALGELKVLKAGDMLARILADKSLDDGLREEALGALKNMPGGAPEAVLLRIAADPKDQVRWKCLDHLAGSTTPAARAAVAAAVAETGDKDKWRRSSLSKKGRTLARRLKSADSDDRREAITEIADKKDRSMLPALKEALRTETDSAALWRTRRALRALECRDLDTVPALLAKLRSSDESTVTAAAGILRHISGLQNGPYKGETPAERADDIAAWNAWWKSQRK